MSDSLLKAALGYKKFSGTPKILVLNTDYYVVSDVVEGAHDAGFEVVQIDCKSKGKGDGDFIKSLLLTLVKSKPDFVVTINHLGFDEQGTLTELLSRFEIPIASWFVDHPMPILGGADKNASPWCQIFCFEKTTFSWLNKCGYENPVYLPTGSNQRYFHPQSIDTKLVDKFTHKISFVGSSWWYKARTEPTDAITNEAIRLVNEKEVDKDLLGKGNFNDLFPTDRREDFAIVQVALAELSMQTRKKFVETLSPLGLAVFGDQEWTKICPDINLFPAVHPQKELPALFAGSEVNTNVTADQMPTAVNKRVWDVPGCAGFLLTDNQQDILDFFEDGKDIAVYSSFEEALDKARYYMAHPTLRTRISENAFLKIENNHRVHHRITEMYKVMKEKYASRSKGLAIQPADLPENAKKDQEVMESQNQLLNVGGNSRNIQLPPQYDGWKLHWLDIDPAVSPDILCDARNLTSLKPDEYDVIYCSHNLEHYFAHDIPKVLDGFKHVLKENGAIEIIVPDVGELMRIVVNNNMDINDFLYQSAAGPITVHDVMYGYHVELEKSGNDFFSHKTGFTVASLEKIIKQCGFPFVYRGAANLEIRAIAFQKEPTSFFKELYNLP